MSGNTETELITKYRPRCFEEVVGQSVVVKSLQKSLEDLSARSYLLTGPSGCGKTTLARIAATVLGCEKENITEVDAATHTGIDSMRSLMDLVQYTPLTGGVVRVVIVDEAHALSSQAWKSLLKSVEEPPQGLYWFFCTTDADKVPSTIKTRCASYSLKPVKIDDILDLLDAVCMLEKLSIDEKILQVIAYESNGSPRQALANLSTCLSCTTAEEAAELLQSVPGNDKDVADLCKLLLAGTAKWKDLSQFLKNFEGRDVESIRISIAAYLTSVLKNTSDEKKVVFILSILVHFSDSWAYDRSQQLNLALALGRCLYSE